MMEKQRCTFSLLRYVPDAVKNEFVNVGLVLLPAGGQPELRFTRDWSRVRCLDPQADTELLESLEADLRDKLHDLNGDRDFILRRMQDSFSNALQPTEFKACLADSPAEEADELARLYLERPRRPGLREGRARETGSRQIIYRQMRDQFERAGVWRVMRHDINASGYTRPGDPLKIDCGYAPNGSAGAVGGVGSSGAIKMFHALSLQADVNAAKVLAFSFPRMADGIAAREGQRALLTAVVEDDLPSDDESVGFALETLEQQQITVAPLARMAAMAETAARELGLR
jgi:hypothetical protein